MAEGDHWLDAAASRSESLSLAIAAGVRYAVNRGVAGAAAFPYALSVGWARGVLQGSAGYLAWQLMEIQLDTLEHSCKDTVRYT